MLQISAPTQRATAPIAAIIAVSGAISPGCRFRHASGSPITNQTNTHVTASPATSSAPKYPDMDEVRCCADKNGNSQVQVTGLKKYVVALCRMKRGLK